MIRALRRLRTAKYARYAAPARIAPYPRWTTGAGTEADTPEMHYRRALWEELREPAVIRWLEGLRLQLFPGNEMSRVIFLTGLYEPNEFCWLEGYLRPGMTVIDGGANMGLYTLYAAHRVGRDGSVVAVEPSQRDFDRLTEHVRLNHLTNVRCRRLALSRRSGQGQLRIANEWNAGHNTLGEFAYETTELTRLEEVELRPLDALIVEEKLQRVDMIKLDVEGAEYDALLGAEATIRRYGPAILIEVFDPALRHQDAKSGQIWCFLEDLGYRLYVFSPESRDLVLAQQTDRYDSENLIAMPHGWSPTSS